MHYNLSKVIIKDMAKLPGTWKRGVDLYHDKKVYIEAGLNTKEVRGVVTSSNVNELTLKFSNLGDLTMSKCTCQQKQQVNGVCQHTIALLLQLLDEGNILKRADESVLPWPFNDPTLYKSTQKEEDDYLKIKAILNRVNTNEKTDEEIENERAEKRVNKRINAFRRVKNYGLKATIDLEVHLVFSEVTYFQGFSAALWFRIGEDRLYKVSDLHQLLEAIRQQEKVKYGVKFTFDGAKHEFAPIHEQLFNTLSEMIEDNQLQRQNLLKKQYIYLTDYWLEQILILMEHESVFVDYENQVVPLRVHRQLPDLHFSISQSDEQSFDINQHNLSLYTDMNGRGRVLYDKEGNVFMVPREHQQAVMKTFDGFARREQLTLPVSHLQSVMDTVLPTIRSIGDVDFDAKVVSRINEHPLDKRVYLDYVGKQFIIRIELGYGKTVINPLSDHVRNLPEGQALVRQFSEEQKFLRNFSKRFYFHRDGELRILREVDMFRFITEDLNRIRKVARVFTSERFESKQIVKPKEVTQNIRISQNNDFLEYSIEIEGVSREELSKVLRAYKEKKKYYVLNDGNFLLLKDLKMEAVESVAKTFGIKSKAFKDTIELPMTAAYYLEHHMAEQADINRSEAFENLVSAIKEPDLTVFDVPESLKDTLRDYQTTGFNWLCSLAKLNMGGILADDMGLGKTLQVLSYILHQKEKGNKKSILIIAPTSLIYNWASEIEKFTPSLTYKIVHGAKDEREKMIKEAEEDIIITSYALIRRDEVHYREKAFMSIILDEAQHIKNDGSVGAKAVKRLKANHKFALTGTPVENHLGEFWSIFDFVLPGHLGTRLRFRTNFEKPIVQDGNQEQAASLLKLIDPFILRRLKKDVLDELPEKMESVQYVSMTTEQEQIYAATVAGVKEENADQPFNQVRMKYLAALTRLRQICSHPSSYLDNYYGESGKLDALRELLSELNSGGHRTLVFSQFTSVLKVLMENLNVDAFYLDGSTPIEQRHEMINRFNEGERDVFFISLKAGGTGLNLVGADTVIHFDPWWNPAVEDQASDRVYRIGQQRKVHIIKLITKDTIEEKILKLQDRKKALIDQVIKPGETFIQQLTEDEIRSLFDES